MISQADKQRITVIGAGTMGTGIAQVAATAGHTVVLYDVDAASLDIARSAHGKILARLVEKGRMTEEEKRSILSCITYADTFEKSAGADVCIEAIIENLEVKQKLFMALENMTAPDALLATNTSSLSVTSVAAVCGHPSRVIGVHFFNPAPLMRLVEIIPGLETGGEAIGRARDLVTAWNKIPVIARDTPGFIVNRVARPFYSEALRIYEEGIADYVTIDRAMTGLAGFKMGPFTLMDYIGNDINYAVTESVWKASYHEARYKPSFTQKRMVASGRLGRKSGQGFYDYRDDAVMASEEPDPALERRISDRIIAMLINEAADALYWGVASKEDIDLAMTAGANYPKGLLQWADELGLQHVVDVLDALFAHYHEERYRVSPLLREMLTKKQPFYE